MYIFADKGLGVTEISRGSTAKSSNHQEFGLIMCLWRNSEMYAL